jgi:pyruvate,water dikinase
MSAPSDAAAHIVWLGVAAAHDPFAVGGKAASLSRLAARYPVPLGFALTTAVFDQDAASRGHEWPEHASEDALVLPAALRAAVLDAYTTLAARCGLVNPAVAVRSSAVDEDGGDASFAGQHETYLNVVGPEAVLDAIQRCWRSFTAPHALEYRRRQGLPTAGVRVAILVQRLVIADAAAVAFTADPVTGARDTVVINASWGLGESIVGGTVTPDVYAVQRTDLSILRREIAEKRRMTVAVADGTAEVSTPAFLSRRPALTDDQAVEIARLALALEAENGRPVDVECAFGAGRLYLLQCRPITTLGHEPADAPSPPTV